MFACIYAPGINPSRYSSLANFGAEFSPLVEETSPDSVILDLHGSELLNGPASRFHEKVAAAGRTIGFKIITATASNPDAAYHAAHGIGKSLFVEAGKEKELLGDLPLEIIRPELASVSQEKFGEMLLIFHLWGIRSFRQLSALPEAGLAERLGPEGVRIRQLAGCGFSRSIIVKQPERAFFRSIELEHPIALKEPLLFLFSRLISEICQELRDRNLAAYGMQIRMKLVDANGYDRTIQFPTPIRDIKTLQKILDLEITAFPPETPIAGIDLWIRPGRCRAIQSGLFTPGGPEPEKMEMVLARIGKMLGPENIGSPELEDSHRPDAFRMKHFHPGTAGSKKRAASTPNLEKAAGPKARPAVRILRPPLLASLSFEHNLPIRLHAPGSGIRDGVSGKIICAAGPWKSSGDWWSGLKWRREDWDLQLEDGTLCRAYRDLQKDLWFVDAIYD